MKQLTTEHWQYAFGRPSSSGALKTHAEDFQVIEDLGYEPSGEGEHQFLFIEKVNTNTAFVAEQLAKVTGLPLRNVTYAGRKDKYAVTRQWFGLHTPGKTDVDLSNWQLDGVKVIAQTRHHKKLRTGQLKGNRFVITLRDVTEPDAALERIEKVRYAGAPNYYGEQRFGVARIGTDGQLQQGGNLMLAERMVAGEVIRNRNKRSMALSALRSWLFNEALSRRIANGHLDNLLLGDALMLTGSNSFFIHDGSDPTVQSRYDNQDLAPSGPLWGKGSLETREQVLVQESLLAEEFGDLCQYLVQAGMTQERRALKIWPQELEWQCNGDKLTLSFRLPSGCFATSILREILDTDSVPPRPAHHAE
ncbi:tRNA pseudouridine(13) synthase TruD [Alteromonas aestuariivivens]|uniref:tRNA pseudouridine synthase D n=1 Tax=Alteromonas aestuariivivens TaxID=1938339 RepID=A0A3D8MBU4_9ALTE|nr:tRNA pseudouridine(13) synthase TruD [Alteromonas aestuariivivens]RDV27946.1 tRNA pseudouridine(13) synthase TruD [Alteromonas aestuariivivens]